MKQDYWKMIRENMREVRKLRDTCLREIRQESKEERRSYRQRMSEVPEHDYSGYRKDQIYREYNNRLARLQDSILRQYNNDQVYYLIYRDGSDVTISAEDILLGEKFPKITDVVYAEMSSADDHVDTETGELDWISDSALDKYGDYDSSYAAKDEYEIKIQFKYETEWARRHSELNPFDQEVESSIVFL